MSEYSKCCTKLVFVGLNWQFPKNKLFFFFDFNSKQGSYRSIIIQLFFRHRYYLFFAPNPLQSGIFLKINSFLFVFNLLTSRHFKKWLLKKFLSESKEKNVYCKCRTKMHFFGLKMQFC
jgi:hypothetical protein